MARRLPAASATTMALVMGDALIALMAAGDGGRLRMRFRRSSPSPPSITLNQLCRPPRLSPNTTLRSPSR